LRETALETEHAMTSEPCNKRNRHGSGGHVLALIGAIWILLNALASTYVVTHADSGAVRQFLDHLNPADAPPLPNNVD
jgi:hypothetical protein